MHHGVELPLRPRLGLDMLPIPRAAGEDIRVGGNAYYIVEAALRELGDCVVHGDEVDLDGGHCSCGKFMVCSLWSIVCDPWTWMCVGVRGYIYVAMFCNESCLFT